MGTSNQRIRLILLLAALGLTACAWPFGGLERPPVGSCQLALTATATDEEQIRAVLAAEGTYVVQQEIAPLMGLWAEGGFVANAKNTPGDPTDDQFWLDKDAIRHRYVRTVFPGAPQMATPADLSIAIEAGRAVVTATTQIGEEISPAGDRWVLVKEGACWLIESLTYNLEPISP